jgi:hypothetical protein
MIKLLIEILKKLMTPANIITLGTTLATVAMSLFGGNKSESYNSLSTEGKSKVDGYKKALEAASNAQDPKAAASALKKIAEVYREEAKVVATRDPEKAKKMEATANAFDTLATAVEQGKTSIPKADQVGQNGDGQGTTATLAAQRTAAYGVALAAATGDQYAGLSNDAKVAAVLKEWGFSAADAQLTIADGSPTLANLSATERTTAAEKVVQTATSPTPVATVVDPTKTVALAGSER